MKSFFCVRTPGTVFKMKSFISVALCFVACAYAATVVDEKAAIALKNELHISPDGTYNYVVETNNGISSQVSGAIKQLSKDEIALEVHGQSRYQSPEGENIELTYVANENGYQPQGAHLPTPVPIPDYILKSLQFIKDHPYQEKKL